MITSTNYRDIYHDLVEETNDFTSESGVVKCTTKKTSDIIREILSNYYNIIDYGISDIEDIDGNVYMIIYNDLIDTDIMESLKLLDEKIVKWQVQSEKGQNMDTYDKRLRQIEKFKHINGEINEGMSKKYYNGRVFFVFKLYFDTNITDEEGDKIVDNIPGVDESEIYDGGDNWLEIHSNMEDSVYYDYSPQTRWDPEDITIEPEYDWDKIIDYFKNIPNLVKIAESEEVELNDGEDWGDPFDGWERYYIKKNGVWKELRYASEFKASFNENLDDDNFKLHHSLLEDIPTFWEWLDDQGLDSDVIEDNPDLEEWARQQYDITFNLKNAEDYDLLDIDVPDDYDDFDFYHHEEELPGYHYVCYFDDDDKDEDDSGDVDTLEKAIEACDNLRSSKGYDCSEIFGPNGDTVATFWEGQWNTNYGESLTEKNEGFHRNGLSPYVDVNLINKINKYVSSHLPTGYRYGGFEKGLLIDKVYGEDAHDTVKATIWYFYPEGRKHDAEEHTYNIYEDGRVELIESLADGGFEFMPSYGKGPICEDEENDSDEEYPEFECPNCTTQCDWVETEMGYEVFKCPDCGHKYWVKGDEVLVNEALLEDRKYSTANLYDADNLVYSAYNHLTFDLGIIPTPDAVLEEIYNNFDQDIFIGANNPREYTADFRAVQEIMQRLDLEYSIEGQGDDFDESLEEAKGYDAYERYIKKIIINKFGKKFYTAMAKARNYRDVWEATDLIDDEDFKDDVGNVVDWCQYVGQVPYYDVIGEIVREFELDDDYEESLGESLEESVSNARDLLITNARRYRNNGLSLEDTISRLEKYIQKNVKNPGTHGCTAEDFTNAWEQFKSKIKQPDSSKYYVVTLNQFNTNGYRNTPTTVEDFSQPWSFYYILDTCDSLEDAKQSIKELYDLNNDYDDYYEEDTDYLVINNGKIVLEAPNGVIRDESLQMESLTEDEEDNYWHYYESEFKPIIQKKLTNSAIRK